MCKSIHQNCKGLFIRSLACNPIYIYFMHMSQEIMHSQEGGQGIQSSKSLPFNPSDTKRITELNAKFEPLVARELTDPVYATERAYEGGYVTADSIRGIFNKNNSTEDQIKEAIIDGILSKLTVGRSSPAKEISYLMKEFGFTKQDLAFTKVQDAAIAILDKGIEDSLRLKSDYVDTHALEVARAVLSDAVVDSRIRVNFDSHKNN